MFDLFFDAFANVYCLLCKKAHSCTNGVGCACFAWTYHPVLEVNTSRLHTDLGGPRGGMGQVKIVFVRKARQKMFLFRVFSHSLASFVLVASLCVEKC